MALLFPKLGRLLVGLVVPGLLAAVDAASAELHGTIRDSQGRPVGATVHLELEAGRQPLTARTDSKGVYHFQDLSEGTYTLRAEKPGYSAASFGPFALAPAESKRVDLTLTAASPDFFDEPNFTVAGVTDAAARGGHGSDVILRSAEALAKATASLGKHLDPDKPGNSLEAVRACQRAAEQDPTEPHLFDWGTELLIHRAAPQAAQVFAKGHRLHPHSVRMLLGLAAALYTDGKYEPAAQRFFDACDLDPADSRPYEFLGKVRSREIMQLAGYVERMGRFARLQPDNALANYYYAVSLWQARQGPEDSTLAQVQPLLERAIRLDPKLAPAYLQLGILYADRKDFPAALAAYRKTIEVNPGMAEAHYRLAQAYGRTGEKQKAQEELALYERLSKESAVKAERERNEIRQFVFTLKDSTPR